MIETQNKIAKLQDHLAKTLHVTDLNEYLDVDEGDIQDKLAPRLRKIAIDSLRKGGGIVAKNFRGEYSAVSLGNTCETFLKEQSLNGAWGTYVEASALGEVFGCNVVVTYVKSNGEKDTWCLYRAEEDAPTIHLYNKSNTHWYVNNKTKGDGNCLYNAFAQALQTQVISKAKKVSADESKKSLAQQGLFRPIAIIEAEDVRQYQGDILNAIQKHPKPDDLQKQLEEQQKEEEKRLSKLTVAERKVVEDQIRNDYQLALKLAREEMQNPSYRPKS